MIFLEARKIYVRVFVFRKRIYNECLKHPQWNFFVTDQDETAMRWNRKKSNSYTFDFILKIIKEEWTLKQLPQNICFLSKNFVKTNAASFIVLKNFIFTLTFSWNCHLSNVCPSLSKTNWLANFFFKANLLGTSSTNKVLRFFSWNYLFDACCCQIIMEMM